MNRCYRAFGYHIASELAFGELVPLDEPDKEADIHIEYEDLSLLCEQWSLSYRNNFIYQNHKLLFKIPETAVFCVEAGSKISIMPEAGAELSRIKLFVLGTCMGVILLQRKVLPLHGSSIVINGKAYAFVGDSGAGKSTLAAALVRRGFPVLSDDVIAVVTNTASVGGAPIAQPAYPQQKLWQESLDYFHMNENHFEPVYQEAAKFNIPIEQHLFALAPAPLAAIFELTKGDVDSYHIQKSSKLELLSLIRQHTYRNALVGKLGLQSWQFSASAAVGSYVQAYRIVRSAQALTVDHLADEILHLIQSKERMSV